MQFSNNWQVKQSMFDSQTRHELLKFKYWTTFISRVIMIIESLQLVTVFSNLPIQDGIRSVITTQNKTELRTKMLQALFHIFKVWTKQNFIPSLLLSIHKRKKIPPPIPPPAHKKWSFPEFNLELIFLQDNSHHVFKNAI